MRSTDLTKEPIMKRVFSFVLLCFSFVVGCNPTSPSPPARGTPSNEGKSGVHVDLEPNRDSNSPGRVKVNAPGVHVDIEK
jgi:hypothetical protein